MFVQRGARKANETLRRQWRQNWLQHGSFRCPPWLAQQSTPLAQAKGRQAQATGYLQRRFPRRLPFLTMRMCASCERACVLTLSLRMLIARTTFKAETAYVLKESRVLQITRMDQGTPVQRLLPARRVVDRAGAEHALRLGRA